MTLKSERLIMRKAAESDCSIIYALWTDPRVMANVGFPKGLRITKQEIKDQISKGEQADSLYDSLLIVDLRSNGVSIGQCMMRGLNEEGISTTDIKLLPKCWGAGFGVEIKRCLINSLFTLTDCLAVEAGRM